MIHFDALHVYPRWKSTRQLALCGHIVVFAHKGPEGLVARCNQQFPWHSDDKILDYIKVAFVGPRDKADFCLKVLCLPSGPLRANVNHILR
jgi:hypothetical protein